MIFIAVSHLIAVARTSKNMLNRNGQSEDASLVLNLKGNAS